MTPRPGIIDFFRGNRTPEPVTTGELVPSTGSEVEHVTPPKKMKTSSTFRPRSTISG